MHSVELIVTLYSCEVRILEAQIHKFSQKKRKCCHQEFTVFKVPLYDFSILYSSILQDDVGKENDTS